MNAAAERSQQIPPLAGLHLLDFILRSRMGRVEIAILVLICQAGPRGLNRQEMRAVLRCGKSVWYQWGPKWKRGGLVRAEIEARRHTFGRLPARYFATPKLYAMLGLEAGER